jgi:uncharacterized repeat protein (TIGR01451 family)
MTIKTKLFAITALFTGVLTLGAFSSKVYADSCVTQYGGSQYGTSCNPNELVINKEVQKPGVQAADGGPVYVENLSATDVQANAGSYITFRVTVRNNSSQTISSVTVKDLFPPYLSYVSGGPSGTVYDAQNKVMTTTLTNLQPGESRVLILVTKVEEASGFPSGQSVFCVVNTAQVKSDSQSDQDTAQVCIKTPGGRVSTLPNAGFDDILILIPSALAGAFGVNLLTKRKSS